MTDKPQRWRVWQFSLRTLLTLTLAFACFFGGWTVREWAYQREMERARQEAESETADQPTILLELDVEAPPRRYDLINDLPDNR